VTWTPDGQDVIYQVEQPPTSTLWRAGHDTRRPPQRIEIAGIRAWSPALARSGGLLAFAQLNPDEDVYRLDPDGSSRPAARSSAFDSHPQLDRDGGRFAFCSTRSGDTVAVWIADADGSNTQQLTHGPGMWQCSPTWSPDGRQIAFDSLASDGGWHIWTIDVEHRRLKQITTDPGNQNMPTWSHDGQWIYFSWDQGGVRDIWRVHLERAIREQLTRGGGGIVARESANGQSVLYQPKMFNSAVLARPLAGGTARTLIPCVTGTAYSVLPQGIYFIPCVTGFPPEPNPPVNLLNTATGEVREIGRLEKYQYDNVPSGFAVSPDGRTVFYARLVSLNADLMLIEHFR
jgi:Tol biopolymer transport system component